MLLRMRTTGRRRAEDILSLRPKLKETIIIIHETRGEQGVVNQDIFLLGQSTLQGFYHTQLSVEVCLSGFEKGRKREGCYLKLSIKRRKGVWAGMGHMRIS